MMADPKTPREPDKMAVRHLIVALERMTAGRLEDAQRNIEYARARLAAQIGSYPPNPDPEEEIKNG
jgi:hypothetical protein